MSENGMGADLAAGYCLDSLALESALEGPAALQNDKPAGIAGRAVMVDSPFADILCPALAELSSYTPVAGDYEVRLDANEAPELLSETAKKRLVEVAAGVTWERYPDATATLLREALARYSGVSQEEILVGDGSDEIITMLLSALSQPRDRADGALIMTTTPSFVMYRMSARVRGQRVLEVPLDQSWDLAEESMLRGIELAPPNVIFIASPNNPTGNLVDRGRLERVIQAAPKSLVVIDEAYIPYAGGDQLELYRRYENVAVMRTLSKIGFAALRVGWLIGRPTLVTEVDKVRLPYNMNSLAQVLGRLAVTELAPEISSIVRSVVAERARVSRALTELPGVTVTPSQANFLWFRSERPAAELFQGLAERSVLVRSFHQRGGRLAHQLRVTIGTAAENDRFLAGLRELL
jgi:histidinol-phosphate aminotransferase